MPRNASRYQLFAEDCIDMAARVPAVDRPKLERMAAVWLSLATDELMQRSRDLSSIQGMNGAGNDNE
jgi:hypothetical protein